MSAAKKEIPVGLTEEDLPVYSAEIAAATGRSRSFIFKEMKCGNLKGFQNKPRSNMYSFPRYIREWLNANPVA